MLNKGVNITRNVINKYKEIAMKIKEKKYNLTVYMDGGFKEHYTFTQTELDKLKKDVKSTLYDGSYRMKNGDLVEYKEVA